MTNLNDIIQEECDSLGKSEEKRVYAKPDLMDYGSVVALTAGARGSGVDANGESVCTGSEGTPCDN